MNDKPVRLTVTTEAFAEHQSAGRQDILTVASNDTQLLAPGASCSCSGSSSSSCCCCTF